MLLGGLALAFSRLMDDSVVVLENIFRYMEMGQAPHIVAEKGGMKVSLAVLAATSTTSIVFFPVTFFAGVSKYIFTGLALGVVLSIFASYVFAMTVVPLYCSKFIHISMKSCIMGLNLRRSSGDLKRSSTNPSIGCWTTTRFRLEGRCGGLDGLR